MYKSLVFGDEFSPQGLHLKSHQRCSAGIRTWLSADQSANWVKGANKMINDTKVNRMTQPRQRRKTGSNEQTR